MFSKDKLNTNSSIWTIFKLLSVNAYNLDKSAFFVVSERGKTKQHIIIVVESFPSRPFVTITDILTTEGLTHSRTMTPFEGSAKKVF